MSEDDGFQITGQERFQTIEDLLRGLSEMGSIFSGVKLSSVDRQPTDMNKSVSYNNKQIIERQAELGRDVVDTTPGESERIAREFAGELEKRAQAHFDTGADFDTNGTAAASLRRAMIKYMEIASEKINSQQETGGGSFADLTPEYKKQKDKYYPGQPILVASGQLLANLNPGQSSGLVTPIKK